MGFSSPVQHLKKRIADVQTQYVQIVFPYYLSAIYSDPQPPVQFWVNK